MNRSERRAFQATVRKRNVHGPDRMQSIPVADWPRDLFDWKTGPVEVWKSRRFLAQIFLEPDDVVRISVCRTTINVDGSYRAGIPWEDLQKIKAEIGYGDCYAIEVYPRERDLVNVANMRHLWILPAPLDVGWFRK